MLQGFNHNIRYHGRLFHVQTEDGGLQNPHIVTLLYHGGSIVSSKKTAYADILTSDRRDEVVREIMREQHRQMLRDLREGRFDAVLASLGLGPAGEASGGRAPYRPAGPTPAAAAPVDDPRDLDEILLDHLASRVREAKPKKKR